MILTRFGIALALTLFLLSPTTTLEASDDVAARTVRIGDRLLVLAAPPHSVTETADMLPSRILSMLESEAILRLRGEDLDILFADGGSVRIVGWSFQASSVRLPSGSMLSASEALDLLRSSAGGVEIAVLEAHAILPPTTPDKGTRGIGSTRGMLGEEADWFVARKILGPADQEPSAFRAYGYLLFADNTAEGPDFERRLAAISAYVRQFEDVEAPMRRLGVEQDDTALLIAMVDDDWDPSQGDPNSPEAVVEALMRAYDFARSRLLLRRLQLPTRGPYIVSGRKPLLDNSSVDPDDLLVMDLSWIEPHLVDLWLTEFRRIAEGEYEWNSGSLRPFALQLLTGLETIGKAFGMTRDAVASVIKLPES